MEPNSWQILGTSFAPQARLGHSTGSKALRVSIQRLAVTVIGVGLASACGASVDRGTPEGDRSFTPSGVGDTAGASVGGTAGASVEATVGSKPAGGGADFSWSSGGAAGLRSDGEAGVGGGSECEGDYECPEVLYPSHATIKVDLPISIAEAADAIFTTCRNHECYSAKGSAQADSGDGSWVLTDGPEQYPIFLNFGGSQAAPFAELKWIFVYYDKSDHSEPRDHYSLSVKRDSDAAPTTLFDEQVKYGVEIADENGPYEHYCGHCYEVPAATVDERSAP